MAGRFENFDLCQLRVLEVKLNPDTITRAEIEVSCPSIVDSGSKVEKFEGESADLFFVTITQRNAVRDAEKQMRTTLGLGKCVSCVYAKAGVQDQLGVEVTRTEALERQLKIETETARQRKLQVQLDQMGDPYFDPEA